MDYLEGWREGALWVSRYPGSPRAILQFAKWRMKHRYQTEKGNGFIDAILSAYGA